MKSIVIIPARYKSTRFPAKVLADLDGKPIIQYVWENAQKAKYPDTVIIATDHPLIYQTVKNFGGKVFLTSSKHQSGTDRIAEIALKKNYGIIVNLQADEPLIKPSMIDQVIEPFLKDRSLQITTLCTKIIDSQDISNPNVVKVVRDKNNFALYFSRSGIPFVREKKQSRQKINYFKHIGLYAYRKNILGKFVKLPPSFLENTEKLEQLRALENGFRIKVMETAFETIGVDTPEDLEKLKKLRSKKCQTRPNSSS